VPLLVQAPEVMQGEEAAAASDVYAFGVVLYEVRRWVAGRASIDAHACARPEGPQWPQGLEG